MLPGVRKSASCPSKGEGIAWAQKEEPEIRVGERRSVIPNHSVAERLRSASLMATHSLRTRPPRPVLPNPSLEPTH